jgi:hypothetical protein
MMRFLPAILVISAVFGFVYFVTAYRTRSMRALANRLGWQFHGKQRPPHFSMRGNPSNEIKKVFNVISGQMNGRDVVIFDSILYGRRGIYSTFLAVRSDSDIFSAPTKPWKVCQSGEWKALWRTRFLQVPWTMTIGQIEERLSQL